MTVRSLEEMRAASSPNALLPFRWVGMRSRRNGHAHVAVALYGQNFAVLCDGGLTAEPGEDMRKNAMGHLPCPVCLAKLVYMANGQGYSPRPEEYRWLAEHALREVGWQDGDPLPVIWRVKGHPTESGT